MCFVELFLDSVVIFTLVWFFQREFTPDSKDIVLVTLGVAMANAVIVVLMLPRIIGVVLVLPEAIALPAAIVIVVTPMAIVLGFALMYFCSLPISRASIATAGYFVYKFGLTFLLG